MTIREAVEAISIGNCKLYAERYYATGKYSDSPHFTGSYFERIGEADNPPTHFSGVDLLAPAMLSVPVPGEAAIGILATEAGQFNALLKDIPEDLALESATEDEFRTHLGKGSPTHRLWDALRRNGKTQTRWGVGPTTASKIMARKRPHLIPIEDSIVARVIGRRKESAWEPWWEALREDSFLTDRAAIIRDAANRPELSTLRALDVALWMHGKYPNR